MESFHWKAQTDEKAEPELSMQGLFMEIHRQYAGKCFHQLKELGIYSGQVPIMGILYKNDGCSQREIARQLSVKAPTVTVSIQRLEKSGLVYRKQDEEDQRVTRIYLTDHGKETILKSMDRMKENEKILFGNFSDTELCLLQRFFQQMLRNIDTIDETEQERKGLEQ